MRKVRNFFLYRPSYRDQSWRIRSLVVLEGSWRRRNGWAKGRMEWYRKLSFVLLDKGGACSFSRVASATEYLPSRWPAVSGDTDGPSFSRNFAETSTRFLKEKKKGIRLAKKKLQKSVKGRCDYRSKTIFFELDFLLSNSLW